jgi:phage tail sheath protein FI
MMPKYLAPGVYIEEIERGPKPIEGVATSTAAFLGETERGPTDPRLVTNYNEYLRLFGETFAPGKYLPYAVRGFFDNGGRRVYVARIVGEGAVAAQATVGGLVIKAVGAGLWGTRVFVKIGPGSVRDSNGDPVGFKLQIAYWDSFPSGGAPFDAFANQDQLPRPALTEEYDDLGIQPASPDYFGKRVNNRNSALIEIEEPAQPLGALPAPGAATLGGGTDGNPVNNIAFRGIEVDPEKRRGLDALKLDKYREVAIVHAPAVDLATVADVIIHCEQNRFRFAVIDSAPNLAAASTIQPRNDNDTKYGAFYYPWIYISDPRTGARVKVPPGGHVCGIYARSDNTRGVFKAPANEIVSGALDLEYNIDHNTQEVLNPRGVNVIRRFPERGIRVWGARTLSSDPLWRYVSVRRLFIFIEASIYNSTQWVVFEPNDQRLWARVKQTVSLFLRTQWREGALFGEKEEEAFSVNVGRETMTEDDILNGRLIIEVGIAPVRPAEFVIFRVFQKTQEAKA